MEIGATFFLEDVAKTVEKIDEIAMVKENPSANDVAIEVVKLNHEKMSGSMVVVMQEN